MNLLPTNVFSLADTCDHVLKIIGRVVTVLGGGISKKILSSLSPLLISADLGIRSSICDVLDIVASSDCSLLTLVMQSS